MGASRKSSQPSACGQHLERHRWPVVIISFQFPSIFSFQDSNVPVALYEVVVRYMLFAKVGFGG